MRIGQRLHTGVAAVCVLFLALAVGLLWYQYGAYQDARRAALAFETLRCALISMEKVSFERGPSNAAMGEEPPLSADVVHALQKSRRDTDMAFARLEGQLASRGCPRGATGLSELERARADLSQARANIDRIVRMPRSQRSAQMLDDAINRMVAIVPLLMPIASASNLTVIQGDGNALDSLQMVFLAAMLREQAGLLGSRFTGALGMRRTLDQTEQFAIERSEGRIEQIYWLLKTHMANHPELAEAFRQVKRQYFADGLAYVADVRRRASLDGDGTPTTKAFAEKYVPMMHSIVVFRDVVLASVSGQLHRRCDDLRLRLLLTTFTGLASTGLLVLVLWLFRRYVTRPFIEAAQSVTAIAHGDLDSRISECRYPAEIQKFFDAIGILRENSRAKLLLEQEHRRLISELTAMAETDPLTGLLNRRTFEKRVQMLCSALSDDAPDFWVSMVLFDIDYFKRINDTYGHDAGDQALTRIADLCRDAWRQSSAGMARLGGEEFAVLLRTQDPKPVIDSVKRFREQLAAFAIHTSAGDDFSVTASFGIAFAKRSQHPSMATLLRQADVLLYQAKAAGRNRIATQV